MKLIVLLGAHGVVHHHPEQENLRSCRSKSRNTRKNMSWKKAFFCKKFLLLGLAIGHSQRQRVFMIWVLNQFENWMQSVKPVQWIFSEELFSLLLEKKTLVLTAWPWCYCPGDLRSHLWSALEDPQTRCCTCGRRLFMLGLGQKRKL